MVYIAICYLFVGQFPSAASQGLTQFTGKMEMKAQNSAEICCVFCINHRLKVIFTYFVNLSAPSMAIKYVYKNRRSKSFQLKRRKTS